MTASAQTAEKPFGARFTFPLLLGSTLNPINSSMIAVGLASIAVDFRLGPGAAASLVSVLYLCSAVAQPTMGKLAAILGPRRVFLGGIVLLFAAGVIGAAAPAFWVLLVSRALIGIGTSAAYPTAMALVRRRADETGTGVPSRVLGGFGIAAQVTIVLGLPIGGVLAGTLGWRGIFFVNVPLAILVFAFAFLGIRPDPPQERRGALATVRAMDLPGIALFAVTIVAALVFLADLTAPVWWLAPVAIAGLVALVLRERRAGSPLIDVRMLAANGPLQRTYLRQLLMGLGTYTALYGVSQWMEAGAGYTALQVGLIMLPLSGVSMVFARLNSVKGWVFWPLVAGGVAMLAAGVVILLVDGSSGVLALIGLSVLFGLPNGLSGFANQATLYVQTPAEQIGVASGLSRTAAYLGAIFSASVISLTFGDRITDAGFHHIGWVVVGIGIAATLLAVLDRRIPRVARESD